MENWIDISDAKKQIHAHSFKYPELEMTFENSGMMDLIVEKYFDSLKDNQENVFILCENSIIQPLSFNRKKDSVKTFYDSKSLTKKCHGDSFNIYHTHGVYFKDHSLVDMETMETSFFPYGTKYSFVAGIDGLNVLTRYGHSLNFPWNDFFYAKMKEKYPDIVEFKNVSDITCLQIEDKQNKRICDITFGEGVKSIHSEIYTEVIYKTPDDPKNAAQYLSTGLENFRAIDFEDKKKSENVSCIQKENIDTGERFLSCFPRRS